jgi:abequosyltransferase
MSNQYSDMPKLSICIATYNRGAHIGETLDSILKQLTSEVELIVVDGASPDNTKEVMEKYLLIHPEIRYFREQVNSGIDADFDKAVGYARGEYCWLMTDDDLLHPNAIWTVLSVLKGGRELIIVNSEVRNKDLSILIQDQLLPHGSGGEYGYSERERLFILAAKYLSYIGCVVIRRTCWLSRDRTSYYGTVFIHVGVIFQSPSIEKIYVIDKPLITIRYSNAMWTPRSFNIWMLKWPNLIWSFPDYSDTAKQKICSRKPWRRIKLQLKLRALGYYTKNEYHKVWLNEGRDLKRLIAYLISISPRRLVNIIMVIFYRFSAKSNSIVMTDLLNSPHAGLVSRFLIKNFKPNLFK